MGASRCLRRRIPSTLLPSPTDRAIMVPMGGGEIGGLDGVTVVNAETPRAVAHCAAEPIHDGHAAHGDPRTRDDRPCRRGGSEPPDGAPWGDGRHPAGKIQVEDQDGISDDVVRVVTENASTLKFTNASFERK